MSRWRAFVDVLDELLTEPVATQAAQTSGAASQATRVASTPIYSYNAHDAYTPHLTPNRFWEASASPRPRQDSAPAQRQQSGHDSSPTSSARADAVRREAQKHRDEAEARSQRPLKPTEESALQTLVRLGAALDNSFTARELRSTFRALAQRYHPDRHPHVTEAERMRLGAAFAELTSAYGVLTDASN